jgi:pilus assembly protein CpaB
MFLLAAVALLIAVGVTVFTYQALRQRLDPVDDTTQIVVAALPVSIGAKLTEVDLRLAPWPRGIPIEGSFQKVSDVVGRGVVVPLVPNEPVLSSKLAASGSGAGLMATIPDGMRAVSVKVNDVIGVAGFVVPGSRVDVILSGSPTESGNVEMAKVILENVQVLAAGQNIANDDKGKPMSVQVVTLLVTPEESQKLALASIDGRIQLALRNPLDLQQTNPNAVRREQLFAGAGAAAAPVFAPKPASKPVARTVAKAAPPPVEPPVVIAPPPVVLPTPTPVAAQAATAPEPPKRTIRVIQGSKQETVTFEENGKEPR